MENQILEALAALTEIQNARLKVEYPNASYRYVFEAEAGKVYTRIVCREVWGDSKEHVNGRAYGFIKNEDLTLWKSAGWKAPAKNKARGVLADLLDEAKVMPNWRYSIS